MAHGMGEVRVLGGLLAAAGLLLATCCGALLRISVFEHLDYPAMRPQDVAAVEAEHTRETMLLGAGVAAGALLIGVGSTVTYLGSRRRGECVVREPWQ